MLQRPVFTRPGCQPISVHPFVCDTVGMAKELWFRNWRRFWPTILAMNFVRGGSESLEKQEMLLNRFKSRYV